VLMVRSIFRYSTYIQQDTKIGDKSANPSTNETNINRNQFLDQSITDVRIFHYYTSYIMLIQEDKILNNFLIILMLLTPLLVQNSSFHYYRHK
jgi:hypothetical protein